VPQPQLNRPEAHRLLRRPSAGGTLTAAADRFAARAAAPLALGPVRLSSFQGLCRLLGRPPRSCSHLCLPARAIPAIVAAIVIAAAAAAAAAVTAAPRASLQHAGQQRPDVPALRGHALLAVVAAVQGVSQDGVADVGQVLAQLRGFER
jgi:hypothetical protein